MWFDYSNYLLKENIYLDVEKDNINEVLAILRKETLINKSFKVKIPAIVQEIKITVYFFLKIVLLYERKTVIVLIYDNVW